MYETSQNSNRTNASPRTLGLLLALLSFILALLAVFFSLHNPIALVLAVTILLFAVRVFVLWLGYYPQSQSTATNWQEPAYNSATSYDTDNIDFEPWSATISPASQRNSSTLPPLDLWEQPTLVPEKDTRANEQYQPPAPIRAGSSYQVAKITPDEQPITSPATPEFHEPIENDDFFAFDPPLTNERCFLLSKEGEPLVECQDRYALAAHNGSCSYAVADGVAGSFVPGPWARVVAKNFVQRNTLFTGKDDFQRWLAGCSQEWQSWIEQRWAPTINAVRTRNGDAPRDWSQEISQGAQSTLLGCIVPAPQMRVNRLSVEITVFAIGDSECFHFRSDLDGKWNVQNTFPYKQSTDFDSYPTTLVTGTHPELVERAWTHYHTTTLPASSGDLVVLATDTLAKWIFTQIEQESTHWQSLLSINSPDQFENYIRREFRRNHVDDDDITMVVIPI